MKNLYQSLNILRDTNLVLQSKINFTCVETFHKHWEIFTSIKKSVGIAGYSKYRAQWLGKNL